MVGSKDLEEDEKEVADKVVEQYDEEHARGCHRRQGHGGRGDGGGKERGRSEWLGPSQDPASRSRCVIVCVQTIRFHSIPWMPALLLFP